MQNQYQNHQKFRIGRGVILFQFLERAIYVRISMLYAVCWYIYLCYMQYAGMFKSLFQSIYTTLKMYYSYRHRQYSISMQAQCLALC